MSDTTSGSQDNQSSPATHFAPPERADATMISSMREDIEKSPLFEAIQDSIDGFLMILNYERQVLAVNRQLLEALGVDRIDCVIGNRPGEVIRCVHAEEGPSGCGTSEACSTCGAVISILTSQRTGQPAVGECLATVQRGDQTDSLEFRVRATPVRIGPHDLTVLVFNDISGEKRRQALERVFFHDIMNTIGGLMGWSELLQHPEGLDAREAADRIVVLANRLYREVSDQRRISQAELGSLDVALAKTSVGSVLDVIKVVFAAHDVAADRNLDVIAEEPDLEIVTDSSLLERVLTNMTKNALEASQPGETVRIRCSRQGDGVVFSVNNPAVMPDMVALRVFQRSFSTKAAKGRGLGTYSMKLFGERYLGGKVSFRTQEGEGTTFTIELPIDGPKP